MNEVRLTGRLTRSPELRQAGQSRVCQFSLAWTTGKGERKQSNFIDCKAWNAVGAELCEKYEQGNEINVRGFLTQESWEDKTTRAKRSKIVIVVMAIKEDGEDERPSEPARNDKPRYEPEPKRHNAGASIGDIDVPFAPDYQWV